MVCTPNDKGLYACAFPHLFIYKRVEYYKFKKTSVCQRGLTTEEFISRAKKIHCDKYDYSKVKYVNMFNKVCIICPIHGEFLQLPSHHLRGVGCKKCFYEHKKKLVFNVGINDLGYSRSQTFYIKWRGMLERCYSKRSLIKNKSYSDCFVNKEWHLLSNFKKWFDKHYIEGWQIDKDILVKGNREYLTIQVLFCATRNK